MKGMILTFDGTILTAGLKINCSIIYSPIVLCGPTMYHGHMLDNIEIVRVKDEIPYPYRSSFLGMAELLIMIEKRNVYRAETMPSYNERKYGW